ncbi:MAG: carboxypeptidase regulatory-like domain-containing protein [Planctomycetes bacterium]|nr:carboxypeptidase regulatory-like domain-containing protein [Planctomycetota bacterium]
MKLIWVPFVLAVFLGCVEEKTNATTSANNNSVTTTAAASNPVANTEISATEQADKAGTLEGSVTLNIKDAKDLPKFDPIKNKDNKDVPTCHTEITDERLIVWENKDSKKFYVKNTVIIITELQKGAKGKRPKEDDKYTIDQLKCVYIPHILIARRNKKIEVTSSDEVTHNINISGKKNKSENILAGPKKSITYTPQFEEELNVLCNVHTWMKAYVVVVNNPNYATVTDDKGKFTIKDIPEGKYTLRIWHEELKELTKEIEIKADQKTELEISYELKK